MTDLQNHSIWLVPEPEARVAFAKEILRLTRFTGTPVFDPHVTLLGDLYGSPARSLRLCSEMLQRAPIKAEITGVAQTESFFMALFLDLELYPDPTKARSALAHGLNLPITPFRPHLSLAYGLADAVSDPLLIEELRQSFLGKSFVLNAICSVASSRDLAIDDWRVLESRTLSSATGSPGGTFGADGR